LTVKTIHISHSIDLPVAAHDVWNLIADYSRDPEWRTGVQSMTAEPPGLVDVGTVTVELLRFGGKTYRNVGEIVAVDVGRTIRWQTTDGADADGRRTITPHADGTCRLTLELNVRPAGTERLLTPVLTRLLARNLRRDLEHLRLTFVGDAQPTTRPDTVQLSDMAAHGSGRP
jgi:hypothetical protein